MDPRIELSNQITDLVLKSGLPAVEIIGTLETIKLSIYQEVENHYRTHFVAPTTESEQ
jgi:predicted DNA-binding protein with PD1-like motif